MTPQTIPHRTGARSDRPTSGLGMRAIELLRLTGFPRRRRQYRSNERARSSTLGAAIGTHGTWRSWSAHLLWEQPEECAVQSGVSAGSARLFLTESGGVARPGRLIRQARIRSKPRPVRL